MVDDIKDRHNALLPKLSVRYLLRLTYIRHRRENGKRIREYQMIDINANKRNENFARCLEREQV